MSGKYCPGCYRLTFFQTRTGHKCSKCGFTEVNPAKEYMGSGTSGSKFSVDSLKYIGTKEVQKRSKPASSAQGELNRMIKSFGKKK